MSMLCFAFFGNAHLNKGFPMCSLSSALLKEMKGAFERISCHLEFPLPQKSFQLSFEENTDLNMPLSH